MRALLPGGNGVKIKLMTKKQVAVLLGGIAAVYASFGALLYFNQDSFIYIPSPQDFYACPALEGAELEWRGTRIYYVNIENEKGVVVFYHGNAGSACDRAFLAGIFAEAGFSTVLVEYAGYSNDPAPPSTERIFRDVENADDFIRTIRSPFLAVGGESVGGGPAALHASRNASTSKLLLIAPFTSLADMAQKAYPLYPARLLLKGDFDNAARLREYRGELRVIHGTEDEVIPFELGRRLYDGAASPAKAFIEVPGARHNDMYARPETIDAIREFLK